MSKLVSFGDALNEYRLSSSYARWLIGAEVFRWAHGEDLIEAWLTVRQNADLLLSVARALPRVVKCARDCMIAGTRACGEHRPGKYLEICRICFHLDRCHAN